MIAILVIVIVLLAYFNVDISTVVESKPVQAIWGFMKTVWTNFIAPAAKYVWNNILHDFIYENITDFFTKAQEQIADKDIRSLIGTTTPAN